MRARPRNLLLRLLTVSAVAAASLTVAVPASAAAPTVTITPVNSGDTAVHDGLQVDVRGTADAGTVQSARFLGREADGDIVFQDVSAGALNRVALPPNDFLRNDMGVLTGRLTLPCIFSDPVDERGATTSQGPFDPNNPCATHDAVVEAWLEVTVAAQTGESNRLPVDFARPTIVGYELISTDEIRVRFSEPVRHRQCDAPSDWQVTVPDRRVVAVTSPGGACDPRTGSAPADTRVLTLDLPVDEDARPVVTYTASDGRVPGRQKYVDGASNEVLGFLQDVSADLVRPPLPRITAVGGTPVPPAEVAGTAAQPVLSVDNLRAGHTAFVQLETADAAPVQGTPVVAEGGSTTLTSPPLPGDGRHVLRVVVRDPNRNLSTESEKAAARSDSGPSQLGYVLDTRVPLLVGALAEAGKVRVLFSEPVSGGDRPDAFLVRVGEEDRRVTRVEEDVEGSGDTRLLTVERGAPAGARLDYLPGDGTRYADPAGNRVPDAVGLLVAGIAAPVVDAPVPFTAREVVPLAGSLAQVPREDGSVVDVFRDQDRNGVPDGPPDSPNPPIATAAVGSDGRWSVDAPLLLDTRNDLLVRGRDSAGRTGPAAPVPPVVQDRTRPALMLLAPAAGAEVAGGRTTVVRWSTSDANPGTVLVELSTDGVSFLTAAQVPAAGSGEQSVEIAVPDVDTSSARVRLTAVDRARNSTVQLSPPFVIDAVRPSLGGLTSTSAGGPTDVRVRFTEPVSGPIAPTDFSVGGRPATVVSIDGDGATPLRAQGTRNLVLRTTPFGPDDQPVVRYQPSPLGQLVDRVGQALPAGDRTAVDGIRPPTPRIESVDGRPLSGTRTTGNTSTPAVTVSGVTPGHSAFVERLVAGVVVDRGAEVRLPSTTSTVVSPVLPADGEHLLRVVVRDANGRNLSTDDKPVSPADSGPSSRLYNLDSTLPTVLFAVADSDEISVRFSEPLFPAGGDPADWRVTREDGSPVPLGDGRVTVVAVRGAGDTRVLQATGVRPGDVLLYAPQGQRYADADGSTLSDTRTVLLAVAPPVVTTPARALIVAELGTPVAGSAQPGSTVSLFRRSREGLPAGSAVASARTGDDGRWSLTAPLEADRANDFLVQAQRTDGRTTIAVPVPTITQDSAAPVLSVTGFPGDQQRLAPGSARTLSFSVCDANLGPTPMAFEFSADDGATWSRLGPERLAGSNDCAASTSRRVTLPGAAETTSARLRVSAVDLAGRTTRVVSPRFALVGESVVRDVRGYACPPDRVQPAGFTDTSTSTFRFEIDCLAAYAFTKGVTTDRYDPAGQVTRAQMALFVARVASYAGVPLDTSDAGFTDVRDRSQETRDAINALANLDVVEGVGGGRYAPAAPVSRGQMASFLARVQQRVGVPFATTRNAFRDDDRTTHEANIDLIAGAGIVQGTAPGTYQPLAPITRQQMAGFLMRYVDGQIEAGELRSAYP